MPTLLCLLFDVELTALVYMFCSNLIRYLLQPKYMLRAFSLGVLCRFLLCILAYLCSLLKMRYANSVHGTRVANALCY